MKTKWFTIEELIRCYRERKQDRCEECRLHQAAKSLPNGIEENVVALADEVLGPAREALGEAVTVNSGFRCPIHNSYVGGVSNSQHIRGQAADITAGSPEKNLKLARIIARQGKWDNMILYVNEPGSLAPRFIHVSYNRYGNNRKTIFKQVKGQGGYVKVTIDELNG